MRSWGGAGDIHSGQNGLQGVGNKINEVGVDISRKLKKNSGLEERTEFHLGDAMEMPFVESMFDLGISLNVKGRESFRKDKRRKRLRIKTTTLKH